MRDEVRFTCGLEMIKVSQLVGRNSSVYQQYDTTRVIGTLYSNIIESLSKVSELNVALEDPREC